MSKNEAKLRYLKAGCAICTALVLFALGIMLVGYQPFDGKRVGTTIVVAIAAIVCGYKAHQLSSKGTQSK